MTLFFCLTLCLHAFCGSGEPDQLGPDDPRRRLLQHEQPLPHQAPYYPHLQPTPYRQLPRREPVSVDQVPPRPVLQHEQLRPHPAPQYRPQTEPVRSHEHLHEGSSRVPRPHEPPAHQPRHRSRRGVNEHPEHQNNPYYVDLRDRANRAKQEMKICSRKSHQAYRAGDKTFAKELSERSKEFCREMDALNLKASNWIFSRNNTERGRGEVDLHGLYVNEAIPYADRAVEEARKGGENSVRLIVGKGKHSENGASKLCPAIKEHMRRRLLVAALDPRNTGVLVVRLGGV